MNKNQLDEEDLYLLSAFEVDEFESDLTNSCKKYLAESVEAVFKKDKRINMFLLVCETCRQQKTNLGFF